MKIKIVLILLILAFLVSEIFAESDHGELLKLKEVEIYTGLAKSQFCQPKKCYSFGLIGCEFGFNLLEKPYSKLLLEVEVGPFVNPIIMPKNEIEFGSDLLIKIGYKGWGRIMPYFKGGSGLIYASPRFERQSTKLNFLVQAGSGISYFLNEKESINVEYRYRHFSNAGIKYPNGGVNVGEILIGFSYLF